MKRGLVLAVIGFFLVGTPAVLAVDPSLSLSPSSGTYYVTTPGNGDPVNVQLRVQSPDDTINVIEAVVTYDPAILELQSLDMTSSNIYVADLGGAPAVDSLIFPENASDPDPSATGSVDIVICQPGDGTDNGTTDPLDYQGFKGADGLVVTMNFEVIALDYSSPDTSVTIAASPTSKVIEDTGAAGNEILGAVSGATFTIDLLAGGDYDSDTINNGDEEGAGMDPTSTDSDGDGMLDADEPSPLSDYDGDTVANGADKDADDDGFMDGVENILFGSSAVLDELTAPAEKLVCPRLWRQSPGVEENDNDVTIANVSGSDVTIALSVHPDETRRASIDVDDIFSFSVPAGTSRGFGFFDSSLDTSFQYGWLSIAHDGSAGDIKALNIVQENGNAAEVYNFVTTSGNQIVCPRIWRETPGVEENDNDLTIANTSGEDVDMTITVYPTEAEAGGGATPDSFIRTVQAYSSRGFGFFEEVGTDLQYGWVEITHTGDPGALAAVNVVLDNGDAEEIYDFIDPSGSQVVCPRIWRQTPHVEGDDNDITLCNSSTQDPVNVTLTVHPDQNLAGQGITSQVFPITVDAQRSKGFGFFDNMTPTTPPFRYGWVEITHDGPDGAIAALQIIQNNFVAEEIYSFVDTTGDTVYCPRIWRQTPHVEGDDNDLTICNTSTQDPVTVTITISPDQNLSGQGVTPQTYIIDVDAKRSRGWGFFDSMTPTTPEFRYGWVEISHNGPDGAIATLNIVQDDFVAEEIYNFLP